MHKRHWFTYEKPLYMLKDRFNLKTYTYTFNFSPLWENLSTYVPKAVKWGYFVPMAACLIGMAVTSVVHGFEYQLWKERKWDKEPGA
jgi:hypothetical protein